MQPFVPRAGGTNGCIIVVSNNSILKTLLMKVTTPCESLSHERVEQIAALSCSARIRYQNSIDETYAPMEQFSTRVGGTNGCII